MKCTTRFLRPYGILLALSTLAGLLFSADGASAGNTRNVLACRFASYGEFKEAAWTHLPEIGVHHVFMSVPAPDQIDAVSKQLAESGLAPVVFGGDTDLSQPSSVDELRVQLETCRKMGVKYMFLSPKRHGASKEEVYERLRQVGEIAKEQGVTVTLETHPDLGTNGDIHLETMKRIDHPNVRVNFDTANITYYNKGANPVAELEKIIDYVGTVELKDHSGEFETWNFPPVGQGTVDIPGILRILKDHGYSGPLTLEFEGVEGVDLDEDGTKAAIGESVTYVRSQVRRMQLHAADYAMLIGYFVLMLVIGAYFYRYMRGMKDYFSGGNTIPWWLSGVSFYMSSFSVYSFIAYPALCYKYGCVGITLLWVAVPATLFSVLLFAKKWRRARIDSPVEFLETRYSPALRQMFAWEGVPVKMVDDGLKLVSIALFIHVALGFDKFDCMLGAGGIMLLYTFMGGLWAVTVTDFVQFVILTAAVVIVLPLSFSRAGGLESVIEKAPEGFFSLTTDEYGWVYIALLSLLYCLAWSSINWPLIQRYYCVPNEKEAVKVGWLVTVLYIIGPPLMFLPAIAAQQFLGQVPDNEVYPRLCVELLPAGMLGLIIAAMFSATMSMLSSDYNVCAGVLTNDVYRRYIRPKASGKELVLVGRLMTIVIGVVALAVAHQMLQGSGEKLFRTMVTLFGIATAPVAVPMLLGLLSRKVTNLSALLGFIFGLGVGLTLFFTFKGERDITSLGIAWDHEAREFTVAGFVWKMEIVLFMTTALVTLIVMLLASAVRPMPAGEKERAEAFHRRLETPIGELEEDKPSATSGAAALSPFRVVGISILVIGLMMLAVLPWVEGALAFKLDVFLGLVLLAIGGLMTWRSGAPEAARPD